MVWDPCKTGASNVLPVHDHSPLKPHLLGPVSKTVLIQTFLGSAVTIGSAFTVTYDISRVRYVHIRKVWVGIRTLCQDRPHQMYYQLHDHSKPHLLQDCK
jgi:hypothetical protein